MNAIKTIPTNSSIPKTDAPSCIDRKGRVLVISASTGNGHLSVAYAVEQALCASEYEVMVVDALDHCPRGFRSWYRGGYELLVRRKPEMWGQLYRMSDHIGLSFRLQSVVDQLIMSRLDRLVQRFEPDWILCTHSLPQPRLALLRARTGAFRIGVIVTDFYPHAMWLRGEPDQYFVPGEWTRDILEARQKGVSGQVSVTGIPTDARFAHRENHAQIRHAVRKEMGLREDLPTLLLTAGGIGGGPLLEVAQIIASLPCQSQVVVVCGRNQETFQLLNAQKQELMASGRVTFHIEGYVPIERMASLMHTCDLMVSKPGGVTTAESLASGCPMIVYAPLMIPGQEEDNAEVLQRTGAGDIARTPDELSQLLTKVLFSPAILERMRHNTHKLARPNAGTTIADLLRSL